MPRVLYNVSGHSAHGHSSPPSITTHTATTGERYSIIEPPATVADSSCLGSHRCRIYDIAHLLTSPRWLGASSLHMELISGDAGVAEKFAQMLQSALQPQIHAAVTTSSASAVDVHDIRIDDMKVDPSRLLALAPQVLYIELTKPRNWRAKQKVKGAGTGTPSKDNQSERHTPGDTPSVDSSSSSGTPSSSSLSLPVTVDPLSSLLVTPPSSPFGASLCCSLLTSSSVASESPQQAYLDRLAQAIAAEVRCQKSLLTALIANGTQAVLELKAAHEMESDHTRKKNNPHTPTGEQADGDVTTNPNGTSAPPVGSSAEEDVLLSRLLGNRNGSSSVPGHKSGKSSHSVLHGKKKCKGSSTSLTSRIQQLIQAHEETRSQLSGIMNRHLERITAMHACNVCEKILRIEVADEQDIAAVGGGASLLSSPLPSPSSSSAAPFLSSIEVLARFAQLQDQLRQASGQAKKAKRKQINIKIRDLKEKYAGQVEFPDTHEEAQQQQQAEEPTNN